MTEPIETLTIEGFAGIESLEIQTRPFTVLIGPQSVGKSIAAKLLFFFKNAPRVLYLEALQDSEQSASETLLEYFAKILPSPTHSKGAATITYLRDSAKFTLHHDGSENGSWEITMPVALRQAFRRLKSELEEEEDGDESIYESNVLAKDAYRGRIRKLWEDADVWPRFVPAGRSFYSQIERDPASYYEAAALDPFVTEFAKFLATIKGRSRLRHVLDSSDTAAALCEELLSGRYERDGNDEFIHSVDGRRLPPRLWSSGQQEAQPLTLLLQRYSQGFFSPTCLFVEEPEAHLFPASQRVITELIALTHNARQPGMQMFLTTHSPYILSTVNNLLLAGQLHKKSKTPKQKGVLQRIVPQDRSLPPGSVGAFYMDRTGCKSILDPKTGLIDSNAIDEVSGSLNQQFDCLLDLS